MDICFFCRDPIEHEDEYVLAGIEVNDVAELVPCHHACLSSHERELEPPAAA